jgi:hypothetical protein
MGDAYGKWEQKTRGIAAGKVTIVGDFVTFGKVRNFPLASAVPAVPHAMEGFYDHRQAKRKFSTIAY